MPFAYPGVYIEEDLSPGLNISSSETAVPVFAHDTSIIDPNKRMELVDSWLGFVNLLKAPASPQNKEDKLFQSMAAYFACGGGRCYVCPTTLVDDFIPLFDDVTLLVAAGENIKPHLSELRANGSRVFVLFDSPKNLSGATTDMDAYDNSEFAAVYGPWLSKEGVDVLIPPSAVAAGLIARTDSTRGVWKAPANIAVAGGLSLTHHFSKEVHGRYNDYVKPLNLFREFTGKGTLLWGARTLSLDTDRWRYVSVRRLFNMIEQDIEKAIRAMMFEPNNQPTWEKVRVAIENYLFPLWQNGAFQGAKPEEAFKVQVGEGQTMSKADIYAGKLIVEIGINAVRPAEFIILRFTQNMESR